MLSRLGAWLIVSLPEGLPDPLRHMAAPVPAVLAFLQAVVTMGTLHGGFASRPALLARGQAPQGHGLRFSLRLFS